MIAKKDARLLRKYFILTYLIFWLLLALTGYMISIEVPELMQTIMKNVDAWTPTFVILIMFKKLYPGMTFKEYMKLHFMKKINPRDFLVSFLLQAFIVAAAILSFFIINDKSLNTMVFISVSTIIPVVIINLTAGVLGEELGWRGYALNLLQKKYIPLISSLIVGVIWGLWHLPLIILSGYSGLELVYYMIAFMVAVISFSVIITFFYNKSKNVLIAMWMHFWFNFLLQIVIIDLLPLLIYVSVGYLIIAILIVILNKKELLGFDAQVQENIA
ncbi:MAG: CPBP family intramembrane metalloprotease [Anaerolineae bacterium]|jgi:membrane protease YdiL (CAAX protease family)|nr:CPBP family intramembrane metalloprotease [Anaerolineae bacterium]MBT7073929.1 CPBP family intramembrane metalloprotease [Anaerolineae bacterium]